MNELQKLYEIAKKQNEENRERHTARWHEESELNERYTLEKWQSYYQETYKLDENGDVEYYSISLPENIRGCYGANEASIYGFPTQVRLCEGYVSNKWCNTPITPAEALKFIEENEG